MRYHKIVAIVARHGLFAPRSNIARQKFIAHQTFRTRPFARELHDSAASSHRSTLTRILNNVGSRREIQQYLSLFSSVDSHKFAVIKVGGAILTDHLQELAASLSALYKVGLFPVVVHGGGPQLNKKLEDAGIEARWDSGIRITDAATLRMARDEFLDQNLRLTEALRDEDVRTQPITYGVFSGDYLDKDRWEMVGKIKNINTKPIESAIRGGYLPVLSVLAEGPECEMLNVNADVAAAELARALKPLKIIYLSEKGGMRNGATGELISTIDLDTEYKSLIEQPWMKHGNMLKIKQFKELLDGLPATSSIAMIEPKDLTKELFTKSGAGTLISRGSGMLKTSNINDIADIQTLKKTIATTPNCVGPNLEVEEYFPWLAKREYKIYYDEPMSVIAIVLTSTAKSPKAQLTTFIVTELGWLTEGAERLFKCITQDNPDLMWAVDMKNEDMVEWFGGFRRNNGTLNNGDDKLFWTGRLDETKGRKIDLMPAWMQQGRSLFDRPQTRQYSTLRSSRTYATNIIPSSTSRPTRVALIGARGYTGQALIDLLNEHPYMDLRHVSSRELAGQRLKGYDKQEITYEDLSADDMRRMEEKGDIDCWVMALPNGVCKPFVDAIASVGKSKNLIVDLSADYRFDSSWTYGLPELVDREKIRSATRISNPGCYATAAQIGIAPLLKFVGSQQPTVFGVSGYSGAGTKPSPKNDVDNLKNNLIPYSLTDHIHEREISSQLGTEVAFIPHVAAWFQGIHVGSPTSGCSKRFAYRTLTSCPAHHIDSSQY